MTNEDWQREKVTIIELVPAGSFVPMPPFTPPWIAQDGREYIPAEIQQEVIRLQIID